jgi:hypothetical protein
MAAVANMYIKIHEDSVGALTLAGLDPQHMTPCSKHYAIKDHWFQEHVHSCRIKLLKIDLQDNSGTSLQKISLSIPFFICNPY